VDVNAIPVEVIGSRHEGIWNFPNLSAAQKMFPELDPYRSTSRFTDAMRGELDNAPALRFENLGSLRGLFRRFAAGGFEPLARIDST
jgi:hypothetical protein